MRISKWIDMGAEVEVELSTEDIRAALAESFEAITCDRLGEEEASPGEVARALNGMAVFLNALTDQQIALMTTGQRKVISEFLAKASGRFGDGRMAATGEETR